ncbi:MAG: Stp1/IreP family PP2C-type Ser/Thr phosphatase [Clostridia bacterium]|nr:Stp1/IreP family PP2C-type Ser/Thr phosphatase [Clostridia bacterium]
MNRKFHFTKATRKSIEDFVLQRRELQKELPAHDGKAGLVCAALTHTGKVRPANQDALVVSEEKRIFGVADGMGGHKGGETASTGCRDALLAALAEADPGADVLRKAIEKANAALFQQQKEDENLSGMGTTLSVAWLSDSFVYIAHVGDSRVYCLRDGEFQQMTDDHSLVEELVRKGMLTDEEARNHPMRNVILRAVGTEEDILVDMAVEERRAGDIWLICSDGLHGMVPDAEMETILRENEPDQAAELLMNAALAAGGRDNISLVVLQDKEGAK